MSETPATGALQFDTAEAADNAGCGGPEASVCGSCGAPLAGEYHTVNGAVLCATCRARIEGFFAARPGFTGFARALVAGTGAAALGWVVWYAILSIVKIELGLIAIVVGLGVGFAVRWGSGGRGGPLYQALAVMLTYFSIVTTYMPAIAQGFRHADRAAVGPAAQPGERTEPGAPISAFGWLIIFVIACIAPFAAGFRNIIGIIIIGIALYEAWRITRRPRIEAAGPFAIRNGGP